MFKTVMPSEIVPGSVEDKTVKRLMKMWTNFAKTGNPNSAGLNVKWEPVKEDAMNFLDIDSDLKVAINPEQERMVFWDKLYEMYPAVSKL